MKAIFFRVIEPILVVIQYLLALFMSIAGVATMLSPVKPLGTGALGFLYSSRFWLVCFGLVFLGAGLWLLAGKLFKKRHWVSRALMTIFMCFIFAVLLNGIAISWSVDVWLGNTVGAAVTGLTWLWWKFKTEYINAGDFRRQSVKIKHRN